MSTTHVDLPGNTRPMKQGATRLGPADSEQLVNITVVVRGKRELPEPGADVAPLSIAEIQQNYGADPGDIERVTNSLKKFGLKVTGSSAGARTVELEGTVAQMQHAFAVDLGEYETAKQGRYRGREGSIEIPAELSGIVEAVLGLDERQVARRRPVAVRDAPAEAPAAAKAQGPSDLEKRYSFPAGTAANQKIGILEFGGGYFDSDLEMYCSQISRRPQPNVTAVSVGLKLLTLQQIEAIRNQQKRDNDLDASGEVNMDIQVIAGLCPDAQILVYFAPFSQKGWVNILQKAIHDLNGPGVVSLSWGIPEDSGDLSPAAITAINNMLKTAAVAGITICVSSGDDGAGDAVNDGKAHCDFPASSPYVLAVGGTSFPDGGEEVGWWDTPGARTGNGGGSSGGGRSTVFPTPTWQNVNVVSMRTGQAAGRCIPDVSALSADPLYNLVFLGKVSPNGGTSASAPLWASLIARIAGNLPAGKTVGFLTPKLYQAGPNGKALGVTVATDVLSGHNDDLAFSSTNFVAVKGYKAGSGYDAVTGWGVPDGQALQDALS